MEKKQRVRITAQPFLRWAAACVTLWSATASGCSAPAVDGYQLQAPPEGFLYAAEQGFSGSGIPGRSPVGGGMWFGDIKLDEPRTTVVLTRYRGGLADGDAAAARDARAQVLKGSPYNRLGPLRTLTLADGHAASAWTEERHDEYGRFRSLQVTAVVSYDTVAFALELDTSVPERMREPHLDSILATFGLGVTAVNWVLVVAAAAVVGALLALLLRSGGRAHATDYRMARVPKPPEPESEPGARGGGAGPRSGKLVDRPPGA
ncbi:MAG TPA: hypothetical protein VLH75_12775 [Longimicrobiales bacterium]|nr:hypothetical protein [Longimicrobiales bacterium]